LEDKSTIYCRIIYTQEEYVALIEWVKEVILLKFIIREIGITQIYV